MAPESLDVPAHVERDGFGGLPLRVVYTPAVPADEIEVTALWDVRGRCGEYVIEPVA